MAVLGMRGLRGGCVLYLYGDESRFQRGSAATKRTSGSADVLTTLCRARPPQRRGQPESTVLVVKGPNAPVLRTYSSSPRSTTLSANYRPPCLGIAWPSARLARAPGEHEWPQHALRVRATQRRDRGAYRPAFGDSRQRRPCCGVCSSGRAEPDPTAAAIVQVRL